MTEEETEQEEWLPVRAEAIHDIIEKELYTDYNVIWFDEDVDNDEVRWLIQKLLYIAMDNPEAPITINLNTDGGDMYEVLRLYDCIHSLNNPVNVMVEGKAFSAGAWIAACCATGERVALKHSTFMMHEGSSWSFGKLSDMKNDVKEFTRLENLFVDLMVKHSNLTKAQVKKKCEKDFYFTAEEALRMGLIDKVV